MFVVNIFKPKYAQFILNSLIIFNFLFNTNKTYCQNKNMINNDIQINFAEEMTKKILKTQNVKVYLWGSFLKNDGNILSNLFIGSSDTNYINNEVSSRIALATNKANDKLLFYFCFDLNSPQHIKERLNNILSYTFNENTVFLQNEKFHQNLLTNNIILENKNSIKKNNINHTLDSTEVIIPNVPILQWYLGCAPTTYSMIFGFWDHQGYNQLIPGGNGADEYYYAFIDEYWFIYEYNIYPEYYPSATEYGNTIPFEFHDDIDINWESIKNTIDIFNTPLDIGWRGAPYGTGAVGHATVGVGYKEIDELNFLILHDTWSSNPSYINFDEFSNNITRIGRPHPISSMLKTNNQNNNKIISLNNSQILEPISLNFRPNDIYLNNTSFHDIACDDFNLDGYNDLILCNFNSSSSRHLEIYSYNLGDFNLTYQVNDIVGLLHVIKTIDVDNDSDTDFFVTGLDAPIYLFLNNNGLLEIEPIIVDEWYGGFTDIECSDLDLDGDIDLIAAADAAGEEGTIRYYLNDQGSFGQYNEIGSGGQFLKVRLHDINGDGYPEILASDRAGSVVGFLNENGNINGTKIFSPENLHGALTFDVGDIDKDGYPEIVTIDDGKLILFGNDKGNLDHVPEYLEINNKYEFYSKDMVLYDLTGDGFPELIIGNYNRKDYILRNVKGHFDSDPMWISPEIIPTIRINIADIDQDGNKDLIFVHPRGAEHEFFRLNNSAISSNGKPVIISQNIVFVEKGTQFEYTAKAVDAEDDVILYSFINYPQWMTVADSIIYGVSTLSAKDTSFQIIASDGELNDTLHVDVNLIGSVIDTDFVSGIWKEELSPYKVINNIEVESGNKLIIEPGTKIQFDKGCGLTIGNNAQLKAIGSQEDSIKFCAIDSKVGWNRISFSSTGNDDTLAYCIIMDGKLEVYSSPSGCGGGILISNSGPTILNSRISKNSVFADGGGIYISYGGVIIKNSIIEGNHAGGWGGGISSAGWNKNSVCLVENSVLYNNSAYWGGGIFLNSSIKLFLHNSIVWDNKIRTVNGGSTIFFMGSDTIDLNYCDIDTLSSGWFGEYSNQGKIIWGNGNIYSNPLFTNTQNSDFTLQNTSPCVDAGDPDPQYNDSEDPANPGYALWPAMGTVRNDMGAYGGGGQLSSVSYHFQRAGWYMVSLPVIPQDNSVCTLFPEALSAFHWDAVSGVYNDVTEIGPKNGYWLAISNTSQTNIEGATLYNYTVHFTSQGWYMIGALRGSTDFTNPNDNPDGTVLSPAFGWNPDQNEYFQTNMLDEKNGYWIAVFGECDLTVGGSSSGGEISKSIAKTNWSTFTSQYGASPPAPPNVEWGMGKLVQVPTEYGLSQNFPNPFNPETVIQYQLPKQGHVTLIIYNMMGQEVRRLVDEEKRAGYHQVVWDGRNNLGSHVGSGIYLIQIRAGSFSQTRKLLLVQ